MSTETKETPDQTMIKLDNRPYKLRCLECEKVISSNCNPMLKQKFEIFGDKKEIYNGLQIYYNAMLLESSIAFLNQQRKALGLPETTVDNLSNIDPSHYKGLEAAAICSSKEVEKTDPESGEKMINPWTGKIIMDYQRRVSRWLDRN